MHLSEPLKHNRTHKYQVSGIIFHEQYSPPFIQIDWQQEKVLLGYKRLNIYLLSRLAQNVRKFQNATKRFFCHYLAKKNQNFPQCSLSNSQASVSDTLNIAASKVPEFLCLKVILPKWLLPFLSLLPSSFLFFPPGNLQGFILVGKDFVKTLRIVGLEKKEVQVGSTSNNIFIGIFRSTLYGVLGCSPACLAETRSFWYGLKNLFLVHKLDDH